MYKWENMKFDQMINESGFTRLNEFNLVKTVFAAHIAGGYQFVFGKRIILDLYGGIGSRVRNYKYQNYIGTEREIIEDLGIWGRVSPSFTLGCRFGVAL
jgi:hypothetical protein